MRDRNFQKLLEERWSQGKFVCVGLDSAFEKIPKFLRNRHQNVVDVIGAFNNQIVDETHDLVCAYKLNAAFYEAHGELGIHALSDTIEHILRVAPDVAVILDAKRGDIGNTNAGYVRFAFELLQADAITVHPYLGAEALQPFLDCKDKGLIVLCRTSNPGARELQDLLVDGKPLYQILAQKVATEWNTNGNCSIVVGATYPDELRVIRSIVGDMPILIPGIGAQGGDVQKTVVAGKNSLGQGMIINASRSIIFASSGEEFAETARLETIQLSDSIRLYL